VLTIVVIGYFPRVPVTWTCQNDYEWLLLVKHHVHVWRTVIHVEVRDYQIEFARVDQYRGRESYGAGSGSKESTFILAVSLVKKDHDLLGKFQADGDIGTPVAVKISRGNRPCSRQSANEVHGIKNRAKVERTVSAAVIDEHSSGLRPGDGNVRVAVTFRLYTFFQSV
jgi:hypothetical protein